MTAGDSLAVTVSGPVASTVTLVEKAGSNFSAVVAKVEPNTLLVQE